MAVGHAPSLFSQLCCKPFPRQAGSQEKRRRFRQQGIKCSVRQKSASIGGSSSSWARDSVAQQLPLPRALSDRPRNCHLSCSRAAHSCLPSRTREVINRESETAAYFERTFVLSDPMLT